jgi:hypothetical protein
MAGMAAKLDDKPGRFSTVVERTLPGDAIGDRQSVPPNRLKSWLFQRLRSRPSSGLRSK